MACATMDLACFPPTASVMLCYCNQNPPAMISRSGRSRLFSQMPAQGCAGSSSSIDFIDSAVASHRNHIEDPAAQVLKVALQDLLT